MHQSKQGRHYMAEYPLRERFLVQGIDLVLEGRADGIYFNGEEYVVEEIKSTIVNLDEYKVC